MNSADTYAMLSCQIYMKVGGQTILRWTTWRDVGSVTGIDSINLH